MTLQQASATAQRSYGSSHASSRTGVPRAGVPSGDRLLFLIGAASLCVVFHIAFLQFLSVEWQYWGFVYRNHSPYAAALAYGLGVLPAIWVPCRLERPSITITWTLYFVVYIPTMFCVALIAPVLSDAIPLMASFVCGMMLLSLAYRLPLPRFALRRKPRAASFRVFMGASWALAAVLLGMTLSVYGGSLRMATLETMYDIRFSAREIQKDAPYIGYVTQWMSRGLLPFLLTVSLWRKRYAALTVVAATYVVLFMTTAHKVYFIVPVFVAGVYGLMRCCFRRFAVAMLYSLVLLSAIALWLGPRSLQDLLFMRTMGWSGLASFTYDDFISTHPLTWWSHVKGVNWVVDYPYADTLPFVIGYEYWGVSELTSNAHFWAMDGIAAAGSVGVIVISGVCAALFWVIDGVSATVNPLIAVPWIAAYATSLGDAGIFSALLTGGLGFVLLAMLVLPDGLRRVPFAAIARSRSRRDGAETMT